MSGTSAGAPPPLYAQWVRADYRNATDTRVSRLWHAASTGDRAFWVSVAAELDELGKLRDLLEEVGVLAANAPEDGDSFGLLEEIAMRIAAADVPDDGRHPDGCTCQFCREDEREERAREELDDDTDNTIPDTERDDW